MVAKAIVVRKSLGPKRPCGFDSRPGHENTLSRYLEGVFLFTWQTFGKHRSVICLHLVVHKRIVATEQT